jgi:hypothetical protein
VLGELTGVLGLQADDGQMDLIRGQEIEGCRHDPWGEGRRWEGGTGEQAEVFTVGMKFQL